MTKSYVNALRNPDRGRNTGIGAEIVRLMKDGMGLSPSYFYDDYEGERPHEMYLLDAKRGEKRFDDLVREVSTIRTGFAEMRSEMAAERAEHAQELAEGARVRQGLEEQLAEQKARRPSSRPPQPREHTEVPTEPEPSRPRPRRVK